MAFRGGGNTSAWPVRLPAPSLELSPQQPRWPLTGKLLHNFSKSSADGHYPSANLSSDAAGNRLRSRGAGRWQPRSRQRRHRSSSYAAVPAENGRRRSCTTSTEAGMSVSHPQRPLIFDASGISTYDQGGGANHGGTVFKLTPRSRC